MIKRDNESVFAERLSLFCLMKSWLCHGEIFALLRLSPSQKPWMKSNPSAFNPVKQDFIAKAISSTIGGFHPSNGSLVDGFDCVILHLENHAKCPLFVFAYYRWRGLLYKRLLLCAFKLYNRLCCCVFCALNIKHCFAIDLGRARCFKLNNNFLACKYSSPLFVF